MNELESKPPGVGWVSIMDEMPPFDTFVETWGGWIDGRGQIDYINSNIGDWMQQPGDPSHWRLIPKPLDTHNAP